MWNSRVAIGFSIFLTAVSFEAGAADSPQAGGFDAVETTATVPSRSTLLASGGFSHFTPKPSSNGNKLDYTVFDEVLEDIIVDLGPSTRIWQRKPTAEVGTRIVTGHKSPFRLEGRRVTFSVLNDEYSEGLTAYRLDLEKIATDYDITTFPRNEQLAFWFNLHNLTVIEQISIDYPTKRPRNIKIDLNGVSSNLHDAKILNIKGTPLSLRDIRENIVYKNWRNPNVIYGFFHGDIGSPAIQNYAYTASRLDDMLGINAVEFVNSLRGFRVSSSTGKVSEIYETEGRFYFPNLQSDLRAHLSSHINPNVKAELARAQNFSIASYEDIIADLAGGGTRRTRNLAVQSSNPFDDANKNLSPEILRILRESDRKFQILRQRGIVGNRTGTVKVIDEDEEGSLVE